MAGTNCCAIQPDTNGRSGIVELCVIHFRRDDILHRASRSGAWYERADQEPRDRGVTVGKVEDVRLAFPTFSRRSGHALETRVAHTSAVVRGNGVNPNAVEPVRRSLKDLNNVQVNFCRLKKKVFVAGLDQLDALLFGGQTRQIIDGIVFQAGQVLARGFIDRDLQDGFRTRVKAGAGHEPIRTKRLLVEERCTLQIHRLVHILVEVFVEPLYVDAYVFKEANGFRAIVRGTLDRLSASISDQETVAGAKLIPLGVAAKIIMIIKDENPGLGPERLEKEVRGRKAAHAAAHHDEVESLVFPLGFGPLLAIAQCVSNFERSRMAAAQTRLGWWIVVGVFFGRED